MPIELERERTKERHARRIDLGRCGRTLPLGRARERRRDVGAFLANDDERFAPLVGATVGVGDEVEGLGLVGALVGGVFERVAVLVGGRATGVLRVRRGAGGNVRALVARIRHAVLVVVRVRAAVRVLEAVDVLGFGGALVLLVGDAVLVLVGAAVRLGILRALARFVGARVVLIEDAVLVV